MRIAICCSSYDRRLDDYVARSIRRAAANFRAHGHECLDPAPQGGLYVDQQRNTMAERALRDGAEVVLYWDADQCIYCDDDLDLAALFNVGPLVGAAYVSRQEPPKYVLRVPDGRGGSRQLDAAEVCALAAPFPCYWIGAGALWVRAEVFKKVPYPWFVSGYRTNDHYVGEDVFFCEQARAAGFAPWCQPAIVTGHMITGMLMHRPGQIGGNPPTSCADAQEMFRTIVGDAVVVHYQERELARVRGDDPEGDRDRDGAPAQVP